MRLIVLAWLFAGVAAQASAATLWHDAREAERLAKAGDYVGAALRDGVDLQDPRRAPAEVRRLNPKVFGPGLLGQVDALQSKSTDDFDQAATALEVARDAGLVDGSEAEATRQRLASRFEAAVRDGSIPATIWLNSKLVAFVQEPGARAKLLENSIATAARVPVDEEAYDALSGFAMADPALRAQLEARLPRLRLTIPALKHRVATDFPKYAQTELRSRVTPVFVTADGDQFFALDVKDALAQLDDVSVEPSSATASVQVHAKQLGFTIVPMPQESTTVRYSQTDVRLLAAALLMPRNATYQFELAKGGVEYEYAFEISLERSGSAPVSFIARDRGSKTWSRCDGARVVNVFGGAEPVTWFANDDMKARCTGGDVPLTPSDVRRMIAGQVARDVAKAVATSRSAPTGG